MLKAVVGENSVAYRKSKRQRLWFEQKAVVLLFVTGLVFVVAGIVCAITKVFEDWVEHEIKKRVVLKPGHKVYRKWHHPESPAYMTYYMFNVTNAEKVIAGATPHLQELGPYTYRKINEKDVLTRNNYTSSSITYLSKSYYVYDKDLSCKTCDPKVDKILNINLPFLTTVEVMIKATVMKKPKMLPLALAVMDRIFKKVNLTAFQTLTVDQLLWGHKDPSLTKAHGILLKLAKTQDPTFNLQLPEKFSLQENHTVRLYTIDSGEDDVDRVGEYLLWNRKSEISCWNSKYARMINGSDATRFKPYISKKDDGYVLVTSVFRSFRLIYDSEVRVRGIMLYRYTLDPAQFISGDINGDNKGFCVTGKENKCLVSGVMDLSKCHSQHAPVVASLPHFYLGDPSLRDAVSGLEKPHKQLHATFIDIEPHTGLGMQGNKKLQINVALRKIDGIKAFKDCPTVYLPLMFVNENGKISEDEADDFKDDVLLPLRLSEAAPYVILGIGAMCWLIASILLYVRRRKAIKKMRDLGEEREPLFADPQEFAQQQSYGGL